MEASLHPEKQLGRQSPGSPLRLKNLRRYRGGPEILVDKYQRIIFVTNTGF